MDPLDHLLLLAASFIANAFSAFAGGGAGLLQLPVLIFLGLPFPIALATHKVATVALGVGATARHWRERSLDLRFALFVLAAGVPGVVLGARVIVHVPDRTAQVALELLTVGLGVYSWLKRDLGQVYAPRRHDRAGLTAGALGLFALGVLNGSLTSGSGLFVTLWLVRWFGFDYRRAVAYTLVLVGMFWNGSGALTLGLLSRIQWDWLPALLLGSLAGGYAGAHLAITGGNRAIKAVFELVTLLVGVKLVLG